MGFTNYFKDDRDKALVCKEYSKKAEIETANGNPEKSKKRLKQALSTAQTIQHKFWLNVALLYIAYAYIKIGDLEKALKISEMMEYFVVYDGGWDTPGPSEFSNYTHELNCSDIFSLNTGSFVPQSCCLTRIAKAYVKSGELDKSLNISKNIKNNSFMEKALKDIIYAYVRNEKVDDALKIPNFIGNDNLSYLKSDYLIDIVKACIETDYLEKAIKITETIDNHKTKSSCLWYIADAYIETNNFEEALDATNTIEGNVNKSRYIKRIAVAYINMKPFEGDNNILNDVADAYANAETDDDKDRLSILCQFAEMQVKSDDFINAQITLQKALKEAIVIKNENERSSALCDIIKIQAKWDDVENVLKIVNGIGEEKYSEALYYIAEAQAKIGDFENALKIAEKMNNEKCRNDAILKIAQMQIDDGDIDQALNRIYENIEEVPPIIQIEESNEIESDSNFKPKKTSINESAITDKLINISRGFEIIGGTFVYKVKILNNTPHRINDIKIQVLSYPYDCLNADTTERIVSKVEPNGGFRSLEFKFAPTHDCVQGVVNSLVTYIDSTETLQTQVVEPIVIKSVCDLLKPLEGSKYEVLDIIDKLKAGAQDEITINDSAGEMFQRFLDVLPDRNFAITDSDSKELGGRFMGDITAAARGKYTNENIGLKITVLDNGDGGCTVHFKACGNDPSMLPTAVEEVKQILDTKALLVMNIMRTLNVIREACRVDSAHSVLLKLEELKVKIDGEVETSTLEKLDKVMGIKVMYDSIEEQLKDHDQERICVYCDHLEGMVETGLVKK